MQKTDFILLIPPSVHIVCIWRFRSTATTCNVGIGTMTHAAILCTAGAALDELKSWPPSNAAESLCLNNFPVIKVSNYDIHRTASIFIKLHLYSSYIHRTPSIPSDMSEWFCLLCYGITPNAVTLFSFRAVTCALHKQRCDISQTKWSASIQTPICLRSNSKIHIQFFLSWV
jgi:hypothetical protein